MCFIALLSAPSGELRSECIESLGPELSERLEPSVYILERAGVDGVQPTCALCTHSGEAVLPQHPEVLRDSRLTDAELFADHRDDLPRRPLVVDEQFEDASPNRVTENIERVHEIYSVSVRLY